MHRPKPNLEEYPTMAFSRERDRLARPPRGPEARAPTKNIAILYCRTGSEDLFPARLKRRPSHKESFKGSGRRVWVIVESLALKGESIRADHPGSLLGQQRRHCAGEPAPPHVQKDSQADPAPARAAQTPLRQWEKVGLEGLVASPGPDVRQMELERWGVRSAPQAFILTFCGLRFAIPVCDHRC